MKSKSIIIIAVIIFFSLFISILKAQEKKLEEFVEVVNIEVPVRVFDGDQIVDGLSKDDFMIFENDQRRQINGFFIYKRKIDVQNDHFRIERRREARFFVLSFDLIDYTPEVQAALKLFFNDIFTLEDKLLLLINGRTVFWENVLSKESTLQKIETILKSVSVHERSLLNDTIKKVEDFIRKQPVIGHEDYEKLYYVLENYLRIFREFKTRYLSPDLNTYYDFFRYLKDVKLEKWAINFYQQKVFPRIRRSEENRIRLIIGELLGGNSDQIYYARKMEKVLDEISRELSSANQFPVEELAKMFIQADVIFHSLFFSVPRDVVSEEIDLGRVASDYENTLREISRRSGGRTIYSGKLSSALSEISQHEDVLYVLTFAPADSKKIGRIKVELKEKKYKAVYDDLQRVDYFEKFLRKKESELVLKVSELQFRQRTLFFKVSGFTAPEKKEILGRVAVRIEVKRPGGETVFDERAEFEARKTTISAEVGFRWLDPGNYDLVISVEDLISKRQAVDFLQIKID